MLTTIYAFLLENNLAVHHGCAYLMVAVGAIVFLVELNPHGWQIAPYGRYTTRSPWWLGPRISARSAWLFQESWSCIVPVLLLPFYRAEALYSVPNLLLLSMFLLHYAYRAFVYPFRIRGGKPMPVVICSLAATFCAFNGYLQGWCWMAVSVRKLESRLDAVCFAFGCCVWCAGWYINLQADAILRCLRSPGETGYKIPEGGAFRYVSCANYFGEILEWCGYAIAAQNIAATAFAWFTFCNTGPRAHHHHHWYREKFTDYPADRRAVIPYLW
mmetsp:Transcript_30289/g.58445  ORF Transcript_30289/g.58445 Transcript_30289/m.58445 type:complete len:272 (-) Transcript_30289:269-1084(-)